MVVLNNLQLLFLRFYKSMKHVFFESLLMGDWSGILLTHIISTVPQFLGKEWQNTCRICLENKKVKSLGYEMGNLQNNQINLRLKVFMSRQMTSHLRPMRWAGQKTKEQINIQTLKKNVFISRFLTLDLWDRQVPEVLLI